jgi:hypothetical protein
MWEALPIWFRFARQEALLAAERAEERAGNSIAARGGYDYNVFRRRRETCTIGRIRPIGLMHDVAGSSPAGGAKEKQIANRRSAFLSFVLLGLNRIAIMIRNVFRFCLQNARVERARKTCDLAERQRG